MSSEANTKSNRDPNDTFKILIATDIHLGYEQSKKRGRVADDSFTTFEEILQYGKQHEVDFVLLGGDLFHDTKPSQNTVVKCMELLRKYCMGPRENKIEFLSDPEIVFRHCAHKTVNYEDPNLNVSMPVFSIHGNHDDPSFGAVGSMDILSVSGLVNYFGKWTDLTQITIPPLVIKKGESTVALYGLSYINDQRLSRLLRDFKVDMLRPEEIPDCFNIFVLHQNRVKHGEYAYVPENKLPNFLNLVIWGHEHECRITPEFIADADYFVSQPGSSVATSLCDGEAKLKHVGILSVNETNFKMKKLRLKTVRPFVFDNLVLRDHEITRDYSRPLADSVYNFVDNYIEDVLIPKAAEQLTGHPNQPMHPLIRLRIFYASDEEIFETVRLGQKYCDEVANPMEMILFRKERVLGDRSKSSIRDMTDDFDDMAQIFNYSVDEADWSRTVQGGIKNFFEKDENKDKLTVLSVNGLNEALNRYVDKADSDAFRDIVQHQVKKTIGHLEKCEADTPENICDEIKRFRDKRREKEQEERDEIIQILDAASRKTQKRSEPRARKTVDAFDDSEEDQNTTSDASVAKGRGKGGTRGTRARGRGRGSRGGRGKTAEKSSLDVTTSTLTSRGRTQTKNQDQSTLQQYMIASTQGKTKGAVFIIDSDSE